MFQKLQMGDSIRVIAPSSSLSSIRIGQVGDESHHRAIQRLTDLGLKVSFGEHVSETILFLSNQTAIQNPWGRLLSWNMMSSGSESKMNFSTRPVSPALSVLVSSAAESERPSSSSILACTFSKSLLYRRDKTLS